MGAESGVSCVVRPLTEAEKQDPKADEKAQAAQTAAVEAGLSKLTVRACTPLPVHSDERT